ncbi:aminotransferase class I/II-fold pyridoxal phosphate-dependent enzyme [Haloferula rosea]|uniref:8-amino-7-oxononanoate synthase n=1 Tax=Haloferula rosea TaxID=490093 RepID=A0A934VGF5_9BACT|nr:8-amino-7-oxononanoate synthase [Haloferula rosea]MBK1828016.1 8-amino-7-oxononanoate synthase [Haloferula rosea]
MRTPAEELASLAEADLLRELRPVEILGGTYVGRDRTGHWNFASNDYLGLSQDESIRAAFHEGLDRFGHGAGASRLITGTQPPHVAFEEALAAAKGTESALLFSSGFATAVGAIPAIVRKGDFVILDKLSHACLIDGARLSGATLRVFPHNDLGKLESLLKSIRAKDPMARILVATESVFSMDGDLCPLEEIVNLKNTHDALLLLDEAHGFGVLGPTGMGLAEETGQQDQVDFHMGTLSKAAGLSGAYLACSAEWKALLVNRARSFIFSTAPPPALAHAASAALELIRSDDGKALRKQLQQHIVTLRPNGPPTPIVPKIFGSNAAALGASDALAVEGFLVPAIRYPTVPRGTARLRISLSAQHPEDIVHRLNRQIARFS